MAFKMKYTGSSPYPKSALKQTGKRDETGGDTPQEPKRPSRDPKDLKNYEKAPRDIEKVGGDIERKVPTQMKSPMKDIGTKHFAEEKDVLKKNKTWNKITAGHDAAYGPGHTKHGKQNPNKMKSSPTKQKLNPGELGDRSRKLYGKYAPSIKKFERTGDKSDIHENLRSKVHGEADYEMYGGQHPINKPETDWYEANPYMSPSAEEQALFEGQIKDKMIEKFGGSSDTYHGTHPADEFRHLAKPWQNLKKEERSNEMDIGDETYTVLPKKRK